MQVTDNIDQQETDYANSQVQVTDNSDQQETDYANSQVQATDNSKQPQMNTYKTEVQVTDDSKQQKLPKLQVLKLSSMHDAEDICLQNQKDAVFSSTPVTNYCKQRTQLHPFESGNNTICASTERNQPKYQDCTLTPVQEIDRIMQPKYKKSKHLSLHVTDKESQLKHINTRRLPVQSTVTIRQKIKIKLQRENL